MSDLHDPLGDECIHSVPFEEIERIGTDLRKSDKGGFLIVHSGKGRPASVLHFNFVPERCEQAFVHEVAFLLCAGKIYVMCCTCMRDTTCTETCNGQRRLLEMD